MGLLGYCDLRSISLVGGASGLCFVGVVEIEKASCGGSLFWVVWFLVSYAGMGTMVATKETLTVDLVPV